MSLAPNPNTFKALVASEMICESVAGVEIVGNGGGVETIGVVLAVVFCGFTRSL